VSFYFHRFFLVHVYLQKATKADNNACVTCGKARSTVRCIGCSKDFCFDHIVGHRDELSQRLAKVVDQYNQVRIVLEEQELQAEKHKLMKEVENWEYESIEKIRLMANQIRCELSSCVKASLVDVDLQLRKASKQLSLHRKGNDFVDTDVQFCQDGLRLLQSRLSDLNDFKIEHTSTSLINRIQITNKCESSLWSETYQHKEFRVISCRG